MKLSTETKTLCSRIALERTRPVMKQTAQELRTDTMRVIQSGRPAAEVRAWLQGMLGDVLQAQARL